MYITDRVQAQIDMIKDIKPADKVWNGHILFGSGSFWVDVTDRLFSLAERNEWFLRNDNYEICDMLGSDPVAHTEKLLIVQLPHARVQVLKQGEWMFLKDRASESQGSRIVMDLGSSTGIWTRWYQEVFDPECVNEYHLFDPRSVPQLEQKAERNIKRVKAAAWTPSMPREAPMISAALEKLVAPARLIVADFGLPSIVTWRRPLKP